MADQITALTGKTDANVKPEPMIVVDDVDMVFNMASEQLNSLKEYFIALVQGRLFFKEFKALENISITVNRGDVYGIVGTNGSGKSTLLKIVAGVLEPSKGSCTINGTIAPLIELGAGFDMELTARENVYLNGALLGYRREFIDENFDSIIEFAEIGDFVDMPLKNYSSGMVARIAFAIATATVPDILVVDEALSVGDFLFQQKCEQRINELVYDHGTTLLFVSHSIDQVERVCQKALWIEKGHMRMNGEVHEVCEEYRKLQS
ncbi:MAG: ABC transporter ATP-binding protein [Eggerthellaceae bacterium]|nr:ABC transporter ATP-binding protein [Eggerthellaceae bacterium]